MLNLTIFLFFMILVIIYVIKIIIDYNINKNLEKTLKIHNELIEKQQDFIIKVNDIINKRG